MTDKMTKEELATRKYTDSIRLDLDKFYQGSQVENLVDDAHTAGWQACRENEGLAAIDEAIATFKCLAQHREMPVSGAVKSLQSIRDKYKGS